MTLIEILLVVAIIGILASIGIPSYLRYQLRSKTSEAKTNLAAIRVAEEAYYSSIGTYVSAPPEPPVIPGTTSQVFDDQGTAFAQLGWGPEGNVFFSYGVAVSADGVGFTADAGADLDADGFVQFWGFVHPDGAGTPVPGTVGCNAAVPKALEVGPCDPAAGQTVF